MSFPTALFAADDILIADFEGEDFGAWVVTGEAFGPGPARGTLPDQMPVSGFEGHGLVNTYYRGDSTTGTLTSPVFIIERPFINFLLGGGQHPGQTAINLLVDGEVVRTATGPNDRPGGTERLAWHGWDVAEFIGQNAQIQIVDTHTGGWGHINIDHIVQSDTLRGELVTSARPDFGPLYQEAYRPQFHFTAAKNWLNDPNGLVFYKGEYHLFFQHNPKAVYWGNMTWGHAISTDMIHWTQLEHALHPDELGTIFSGSAVVDWHNTTGFQTGDENVLVAIYTSAGGTSDESAGRLFTQSLAYSNDRGRTWIKYAGNPVMEWIIAGNRDPKVVWHEPTQRWVMALYMDENEFALFASPDLKEWTHLQDVTLPGEEEVPDFFELPVDGDPQHTRWVFWGANGGYLLGTFDGLKFTRESGLYAADWGDNFYAAQTWSDIPPADGRRLQIGWMRSADFPNMPFNQQMSFPRELTLRTTPAGIRLFSQPIREIENLRAQAHNWPEQTLEPGDNPLVDLEGDVFEIRVEFAVDQAKEVGFVLRGAEVSYNVEKSILAALGQRAPLALSSNRRLKLHILLDRTSVEVFGNEGRMALTNWFLPDEPETEFQLYAEGGSARIVSLEIFELRSVWQSDPNTAVTETQEDPFPQDVVLHNSYPNPFNSEVVIRFSLSAAALTTVKIYNTAGQLVQILAQGYREAGMHTIAWDGADAVGEAMGSGLYFYMLQAGGRHAVKKMMLLR